ncbi:MAG: HD domain-containing phosphohydrolase [Myxococcales bacterium]
MATDPDANKRAAALRLQKLLLRGGGTGQTRLKYQQEVDFGREQIKAAAKDEAAKDITLLAIDTLMASIHTATENLAGSIGHGETDQRPSEQVRGAKAECAAACIWAVHTLTRLGNRGTVAGEKYLSFQVVRTSDVSGLILYPRNELVRVGADIARHHYERWDGTGYPSGLVATHIPLSARIVAVADVYDAIRAKRPYKPPQPHDVAAEAPCLRWQNCSRATESIRSRQQTASKHWPSWRSTPT